MWRIKSNILSTRKTLITNFMCDTSTSNKTFAELVEIFGNCKDKFTTKTDISKDLRVLKFLEDMKSDKWEGPIFIESVNGIVQGGVHRGIAYLICIRDGISESELPEVLINEPIFE